MELTAFREGQRLTALLAHSRAIREPDFDSAWQKAIAEIKPTHLIAGGRAEARWLETLEALMFARPAYRRAYYGEPRTRADSAAQALQDAMRHLYDDSAAVGETPMLEAA